MKKLVLVLLIILNLKNNHAPGQALPVTSDTAIKVTRVMQVKPFGVRVAKNPIDHALYYATFGGNIYKIKKTGSVYSDSLVASVTQHYINYLQGMVFRDSMVYLVGNRKSPTGGYCLLVRGKFKANGTWAWDTLMHTATYPSSATLYDHAFSGICFNATGDSLFISSGSRTDHGEIETTNGQFPNTRDVALTSIVFRIPVNPSSTILLPNDSASIAVSPYRYCRGVRNTFDIALAPNGDLIGSENSGDRDDPEELNWLRQTRHYGFPWRMGGNQTPMQFPNYNAANDFLINDSMPGWQTRFYNDPAFPQAPAITYTEPIKNFGPDADKFRSAVNGSIHDASDEGTFITSFTSHRAPLGLVFDDALKLAPPYNFSAFLLSYTEGTADTTGSFPGGRLGPFSDTSQDLLQLALYKDTGNNQYSMNCYRIAWDFVKPVDAYLDNNIMYVLETRFPNDTVPANLYALTFPLNTKNGSTHFLGKDTVICSGTPLTIVPKLKGQFKYRWSTGATTSQITVSPTSNTTYILTVFNGLITSSDTIVVSIAATAPVPGTISNSGGTIKVCPGDTRTYTVPLINGITYNWSVPAGAIIISGQGTRSISVTYNAGFTSPGTLSVRTVNSCGTSASRNLSINRNLPTTPSVITGTTYGLCAATNQLYSVNNVAGMTYTWTKPTGATFESDQGINNITISFSNTNFTGTVSVRASNTCAQSGARNLTVKATPQAPSVINGPAMVCPNSTGNAYSISPIATAINYTWIGPSGSHITGNGITSTGNLLTTTATNVTVSYGAVTASSTLKARGNNACGNGSSKTLVLTSCSPRLESTNNNVDFSIVSANPAIGRITFGGVSGSIEFFNILGESVLIKSFTLPFSTEMEIDLSHLKAGLYIARCQDRTLRFQKVN